MFRILLTGVLFYLAAHSASANDSTSDSDARAFKNLLNIEIAAYQLSSAFSAYVLFDGAPKFANKLEAALNASKEPFADIKTEYPDVYAKWQQSVSFVNDNKNLVFDGADHRLITGHSIYQNQLYSLIKNDRAKLSENPQYASIEDSYLNASLCFERVLAQYIGFSGSAMGVIHSDISIEDNVNAFNSIVASIRNKNDDYERLIKKWNFIKGNMTSGSSQTAPFITLHTANSIRESLQRIYKEELISESHF